MPKVNSEEKKLFLNLSWSYQGTPNPTHNGRNFMEETNLLGVNFRTSSHLCSQNLKSQGVRPLKSVQLPNQWFSWRPLPSTQGIHWGGWLGTSSSSSESSCVDPKCHVFLLCEVHPSLVQQIVLSQLRRDCDHRKSHPQMLGEELTCQKQRFIQCKWAGRHYRYIILGVSRLLKGYPKSAGASRVDLAANVFFSIGKTLAQLSMIT